MNMTHTPEPMSAVYDELNAARRKAIVGFWATLLRCLASLPLVFGPLALIFFAMTEHPTSSPQFEQAKALREWIAPFTDFYAIGMCIWMIAGLYLVGRHFVRSGRQPIWDYKRSYKQRVLTAFCEREFETLRYDPDGYIGYPEFDATRLFPYSSDVYRSEDGFNGRVGKTDLRFAEVHAERERRDWLSKDRDRYYETFFKGLVFIADFHKHFHSTTRLIPAGERGEVPLGRETHRVWKTRNSPQPSIRSVTTRWTCATC